MARSRPSEARPGLRRRRRTAARSRWSAARPVVRSPPSAARLRRRTAASSPWSTARPRHRTAHRSRWSAARVPRGERRPRPERTATPRRRTAVLGPAGGGAATTAPQAAAPPAREDAGRAAVRRTAASAAASFFPLLSLGGMTGVLVAIVFAALAPDANFAAAAAFGTLAGLVVFAYAGRAAWRSVARNSAAIEPLTAERTDHPKRKKRFVLIA